MPLAPPHCPSTCAALLACDNVCGLGRVLLQAMSLNIQLTYASREEEHAAAAAAAALHRPGVVIGGGHGLQRGGRDARGSSMRHSQSEGAMQQALQVRWGMQHALQGFSVCLRDTVRRQLECSSNFDVCRYPQCKPCNSFDVQMFVWQVLLVYWDYDRNVPAQIRIECQAHFFLQANVLGCIMCTTRY